MNKTFIFISVPLLSLLVFLSGCHSTGRKAKTDWSIPSVKLTPASKGEKVARPAERASAKSTSELAHDRMDGHNPMASIRTGNDPTLRPDPHEIARLNQFEGSNVPGWASDAALPPGPEATAPQPAERIAQNINESTISGLGASEPAAPAASTLAASGTPSIPPADPAAVPAGTPLAPSVSSSQAAPAPGSLISQSASPSGSLEASANTNPADIFNGELPDTLEDVPAVAAAPNGLNSPTAGPSAAPGAMLANAAPANAAPALPQAGSTMMELPGTLGAPAGTTGAAGTPAGGAVQVSASIPASGANVQPVNQAQPAALFMPGNINPQYPNGPARTGR